MSCTILADDVTGAADACAPFVRHGLSGVVFLGSAWGSSRNRVIAVNTESRRLPPSEAGVRVRAAAERLSRDRPAAIRFKKIDSTLRGHVGEEVAAAMAAYNLSRAIIAPAFPGMGRTVERGVLRVAWGDAPGANSPRDYLPTLLAAQGLQDCRLIAQPAREHSPDQWLSAVKSALQGEGSTLICDSVRDEDLDAIVGAAWGERVLWVGSPGLAGALARRLSAGPSASESSALAAPAPSACGKNGPVLFWIGSTQTVTLEQRQHLLSHGGFQVHALDAADVDGLRRHLRDGHHVLVDAGPAVPDDVLASSVDVAVRHPIAGFVISGGHTAARVCNALGVDGVEIGGEIASGIPWGWLSGRAQRRWAVVLKAGGFGRQDAFVRALGFLTGGGGGDI